MARPKRERNFLKVRDDAPSRDLGRLVAEDDASLNLYYVEPERYVDRAQSFDDPVIFFMGPKGVGKSAILQMVRIRRRADAKRIIDISPDDLAFSGLANIQAETPLLLEPGKSQWVFKSLWDYILCIEILKRECKTTAALSGFLKGLFASQDEKAAQKLLKLTIRDEGSPDTLTARILSLVHAIEATASAAGVDVRLSTAGGAAEKQLQLLSQINHVASRISERLTHDYHILIDDLDLHWVDTPIQNGFIAALFLSLRGLCKPPHLKFLCAIRDDIYRKLPLPDKDKLRERICTVNWNSNQVRRMVARRVNTMYECTVPEVWARVFPKDAFDQMWRHSTGKPRELIRLASLCIMEAQSSDHPCVEQHDLDTAILQFSTERLEDLASMTRHEWPGIDQLVRKCRGWPKEFPADMLDDLVLKVAEEIEAREDGSPLFAWAGGFVGDPIALGRVLAECGVLLVKASRTSTAHPFDQDEGEELTSRNWFAFHPMYVPALRLVGD